MQELLSGLPAYQGGKMSEKIYNAGQGLHARINDEQPLRLPTKRDKAAFLYELNCLIDWAVTDTATDLYGYMRVEEIRNILFIDKYRVGVWRAADA